MAQIMVVDDYEGIRNALGCVLELAGHEVTPVEDGRTALRRFRDGSFDLVVADVCMPDMDGLELLIRLRNRFPMARVIVMSAGGRFAKQDVLNDAMLLGAVDVLRKPFTGEELTDAVEQALDHVV